MLAPFIVLASMFMVLVLFAFGCEWLEDRANED